MKEFIAALCTVICVFAIIFFALTPVGRTMWNNWFHQVQTADDETNYGTLKQVEDSCRSMIASYKFDKLTYEQYKDSDNPEYVSWGEQAKIRANKTAATYNEFILKNRYVWKNNVPDDIYTTLPYLE